MQPLLLRFFEISIGQFNDQVDSMGEADRPERCVPDGIREIQDLWSRAGGDGLTDASASQDWRQAEKGNPHRGIFHPGMDCSRLSFSGNPPAFL